MKKALDIFKLEYNIQQRVYGLDVVRTIAILLVLISHSRHFLMPYNLRFDILRLGGFLGVELFFVLSGFLIGGILIKLSKDGLSITKITEFWKRRWFRTLPNYYLALIINILFAVFLLKSYSIDLSYFFFLQNSFNSSKTFFAESWSICIEEWSYLILPLLFIIAIKILKGIEIRKSYFYTLITSILVLIFLKVYYAQTDVTLIWDANFRKNTLMRLDAIFIGVLFAFFKFYFKEIFNKTKNLQAFVGLVGLIFTVIYFYKSPSFDSSVFAKSFFFIITNISVAFFLSLAANTKIKGLKKTFYYKLITHVSLISYSLYLYHLLIMKIISLYFNVNGISQYVFFWIITFIISTLIFKFFEKPFTDLRDRK